MRIGFIGLGRMGFALASSLLRNQQDVIAFDIDNSVVEKIKEQGAQAATDIAQLCRDSDIVFTMLPGPKQVKEVFFSDWGIAKNIKLGSPYIDLSTIDTETVDELSREASALDIVFGDAPVGRLAAHADRGESLFMLGIAQEHLARVEPILLKMGTTVLYCGQAGSGIRTKLVNNLMVLSLCQINSEALVLAKALGLDTNLTFEVLTSTTASNGQLKEKWPNKVLKGDLTPGFDLTLGLKDLTLACKAAQDAGVALPVGDISRNIFQLAQRAGHAGKDTSSLTDFWAELNHIEPIRL